MASQLLGIGAVAAILGVSVDTVRAYEKAGKLAAIRTDGNQRRFAYDDVLAFRDARRPTPEPAA